MRALQIALMPLQNEIAVVRRFGYDTPDAPPVYLVRSSQLSKQSKSCCPNHLKLKTHSLHVRRKRERLT
jgi:hypothetical protein